jgi:hypothetical protein
MFLQSNRNGRMIELTPRQWALGVKTGPPVGPVGSEAKVPDRKIEGAAPQRPSSFGRPHVSYLLKRRLSYIGRRFVAAAVVEKA